MPSILLLVAMGLLFYFVLLRPVKRRQQQAAAQAAQLRSSIGPGDEVVTHSGMYGTVTAMDDESVTLEIAPGVNTRFARDAIAKVVTESEPAEVDDETDDDEDDVAHSPADLDGHQDLDAAANTIIEKRD